MFGPPKRPLAEATPGEVLVSSTVKDLTAGAGLEFEDRGLSTVSSEELARRGGTTSAQVRKDLSFFGSFGKRGLGYAVPELAARLRDILGLGREWRVIIIGAGKIGSALAHLGGRIAYRTIGSSAVTKPLAGRIQVTPSLTLLWM